MEDSEKTLITYNFKGTALVYNRKKKRLVFDYPIDVIALHTEQAVEMAESKIRSSSTYQLRKLQKVVCTGICNAFYPNKDGIPSLTEEEKALVILPENYYNNI